MWLKHLYLITIGLITLQYRMSNTKTTKIWIIRHCDKPKHDKTNRCCSSNGILRIKNWINYLRPKINPNNKIQIIGTNYKDSKLNCVNDNPETIIKYCQKSQRMFQTSYELYDSFSKIYPNIVWSYEAYCVGDHKKLVKNIYLDSEIKSYDDIIINWEHNEIPKIIGEFDISIKKWPNHLHRNYDLIFMIDMDNQELYYDCYDHTNNKSICTSDIQKWLGEYKPINLYYAKNLRIQKQNQNHISNSDQIVLIVCLSLIGLFGLLILCLHAYRYCKQRTLRHQYIEIIV